MTHTGGKSAKDEAERPISSLTEAWVEHKAMQALDISPKGSAAITDCAFCSNVHFQGIYIIMIPLIQRDNFTTQSLQVVQSSEVMMKITN